MKPNRIAVAVVLTFFAVPAQAAQHFVSSLGAVSSLCSFQSSLDYDQHSWPTSLHPHRRSTVLLLKG